MASFAVCLPMGFAQSGHENAQEGVRVIRSSKKDGLELKVWADVNCPRWEDVTIHYTLTNQTSIAVPYEYKAKTQGILVQVKDRLGRRIPPRPTMNHLEWHDSRLIAVISSGPAKLVPEKPIEFEFKIGEVFDLKDAGGAQISVTWDPGYGGHPREMLMIGRDIHAALQLPAQLPFVPPASDEEKQAALTAKLSDVTGETTP